RRLGVAARARFLDRVPARAVLRVSADPAREDLGLEDLRAALVLGKLVPKERAAPEQDLDARALGRGEALDRAALKARKHVHHDRRPERALVLLHADLEVALPLNLEPLTLKLHHLGQAIGGGRANERAISLPRLR